MRPTKARYAYSYENGNGASATHHVRFYVIGSDELEYNVDFLVSDQEYRIVTMVAVGRNVEDKFEHQYIDDCGNSGNGQWQQRLFDAWRLEADQLGDERLALQTYEFTFDKVDTNCYWWNVNKHPQNHFDFPQAASGTVAPDEDFIVGKRLIQIDDEGLTQDSCLSSTSMLVLGGFIFVLGAAAVAVAFTVLTLPVSVGVLGTVGMICLIGGAGLFAAGAVKKCFEPSMSEEPNFAL
jgi:hypothetical protein